MKSISLSAVQELNPVGKSTWPRESRLNQDLEIDLSREDVQGLEGQV